MSKSVVNFEKPKPIKPILVGIILLMVVGWILSPLWDGRYQQGVSDQVIVEEVILEEKTTKSPSDDGISNYKEGFYSDVNITLPFDHFELIIKSMETYKNKATITYELLNHENYITKFIIFKLVDEFGNEAYHRRNFLVEYGLENTAILDIDMLDENATYVEIEIEHIDGAQLEPIGKLTSESIAFKIDNKEYTLEYSPVALGRNRAVLKSTTLMTKDNVPILGYYQDGVTGDFHSEQSRINDLILTRILVEKAVGEEYDYHDEPTLEKIQAYILDNKNRVVEKTELIRGLEQLIERDYASVLAEMPKEFIETVLEAYKINDIEGATIGLVKPDAIKLPTDSIIIEVRNSDNL
jgi:hypothetical protein